MVSGLLKRLPVPVLTWLKAAAHENKNWVELIDSICLDRFLERTDFQKLDVSRYPVCQIEKGEWEYPLLNVCFLENMLKNIAYCLFNGYRPAVTFPFSGGQGFLWETLFVQPYELGKCGDEHSAICDVTAAPIYFPVFPTEQDVRKYGKLYQAFVQPNPVFQRYHEAEYERLLRGKRVLGVLCRGTDYVATKPKGHPVQPEITDVIALVSKKMKDLRCDHIYLATEEQAIHKKFEEAFPGKIIINTRQYYDSYGQLQKGSEKTLISAVHFDRENDSYLKALEYFSSIFLLSECNALIAGSCGGSRAALYLNYGKYEYYYLFNLGVY